MMGDSNKLLLEGYTFTLTEFVSEKSTTAVTVTVSGNGCASADLTSWVLEMGQDKEANLVSCEKRMGKGAWIPAAAEKTTYELSGDIGMSGVIIREWVGKEEEDEDIEFKITFDDALQPAPARIAYISGEELYRSINTIRPESPDKEAVWYTPIDKPFCMYIVVPYGYKPINVCKANVSVIKRGLFMVDEEGVFDCDTADCMKVKTDMLGSVKITVSIPLKSYQACGDAVAATACDCFEVDETIAYTNKKGTINMRDITVCPKLNSFDLTLLNAHCGKSVYRFDGEFVINCKRC